MSGACHHSQVLKGTHHHRIFKTRILSNALDGTWLCSHRSSEAALTIFNALLWKGKIALLFVFQKPPYLDKEDDKEVEVGNSSELLKEILWEKIPDRVLRDKKKKEAERDVNTTDNGVVLTMIPEAEGRPAKVRTERSANNTPLKTHFCKKG